MIVEVITEELYVWDCRRCCRYIEEVAREQDKGHIANIVGTAQARKVSNLERRFAVRVKDLRGVLDRRLASGIDEFLDNKPNLMVRQFRNEGHWTYLEENLAEDAIRFLSEYRREYYSYAIGWGLDINSFLVAIVNFHELSLRASWSFQLFLCLEATLERCRQRVALKQGNRMNECFPRLWYLL
jgi:hypothetical protein